MTLQIPTLRPYQFGATALAQKAFMKHKHVLLVSCQGSGRTFMFSSMALRSIKKGYKVLIVSNRAKLLRQTGGSLTKFGIDAEYISAKHRAIPTGNCIVATAQTLQRRFQFPEYQEFLKSVDFLIIDECHYQNYNFLLECDIFKKRWVLGTTATPVRTGKMRQLGLDYEVIVEGISVQAGIDLGFIVPARHFTLDAPDLSTVEINPIKGEYKSNDLFRVYDTPRVYGGLISEFKKICNNEKTIVFCCSQIHAIQTCVELNNAGISSKFIVSGIKKDDENYHIFENNQHLTGKKQDIEDEFARGEFLCLCNVAVYVAGFDDITIRNVILLRAMLQESTFDQTAGRGSRISEGKTFFRLLDFGGNIARHGLYERTKINSLWHNESSGGGVVMTKDCDPLKKDKEGKNGCGRLIHISYPICPFCGFIFKTKEEEREIELTEIVGGKFRFKDMTAIELAAYAELNGYDKRWVFRQIFMGNDDKGFKKGMRELNYENKFIYLTLQRLKFGNKK